MRGAVPKTAPDLSIALCKPKHIPVPCSATSESQASLAARGKLFPSRSIMQKSQGGNRTSDSKVIFAKVEKP